MLRAIQIVDRTYQIIPDDNILAQDQLSKLTNLVHFHDKKVREAVGCLILTLSEDFEDGISSLLPL